MTEPYLIAHSVYGQTAFDIAEQMPCPMCEEHEPCNECNGLGYWWIIPTSGHRAYPWWSRALTGCMVTNAEENPMEVCGDMPVGWPDHYKTGPVPKIDILSLFKSSPKATIPRRL